jgi:tripartite ATP-independent transporter DctM subunit
MWEGIIIIMITLAVVFSGMPLAFAFGFVAVVCALIFGASGPLDMAASVLFESVNSFGLLTIPLFIFMGVVIANSPAGSDLYEAIHRFLYRLPGGLAMSNIWACAIFSAMCGSSPATAAAIGTAGIPEMRKRGISDSLAAGSIVGGGTLGILIPPSITLIVYGIATETSIGKLFIAGIIPGILMTGLFCLWALIQTQIASRSPHRSNSPVAQAEEQYSWAEKLQYVPRALPFVLLIALIIVSIYGGVATPSEAAGLGALGSVLLVLIVYRRTLNRTLLKNIFSHVTRETAMIMLVAATTVYYQSVLTDLYITQNIMEWIVQLQASRWMIMFLINALLLILGCFLPPFAIILLVAPLLHPVILKLGFDPIWFGVVVTINMEAGCITPPFGINLYVVKGIAPDMTIGQIMKGSLPFLLLLFLGIVILSFFPDLALWLPGRMAG